MREGRSKTKEGRYKTKEGRNRKFHPGLSHFVAPRYVAPSTTPSNAKPTRELI